MSQEIRTTIDHSATLPHTGETHVVVYLPGLHNLPRGTRIVVTIPEAEQ